jgi:hypothetical protein
VDRGIQEHLVGPSLRAPQQTFRAHGMIWGICRGRLVDRYYPPHFQVHHGTMPCLPP